MDRDRPEGKAEALLAETHSRLTGYRQHAIEEMKSHQDMVAFWEREIVEINTYISQNSDQVMEEKAVRENEDISTKHLDELRPRPRSDDGTERKGW